MSTSPWRPTRAEVDLGNIAHNVRLYADLIGPSCRIMAVVKADGYGHGDIEVSRAALVGGAGRLGVVLVEEAERLREAGFEVPIHLLFEPPVSAAERVVELDLTPSVYSTAYIKSLSDACTETGKSIRVHLKLDTGMHRVGIEARAATEFAGKIASLPGLELEGVYTHLAMGSEPEHPFNLKQWRTFQQAVKDIEQRGIPVPLRHVAASGAAVSFPESRLGMIRLGIAMYGLLPGKGFAGMLDLRPAMSLYTRISHVFNAQEGEAVSYGLTHTFKEPTLVGVLPIGYADGFARALSNRWQVLIAGKLYPMVGTICMDLCMVELGRDRYPVGEAVTVIGGSGQEAIGVEAMAERLGTINYEVVCGIGKRVPRLYSNGL
ncbi:MAG: alanine racemase [Candidatus Solincola sediminis]|nr:MAG: alanine racemase [Candidatus Solincola sediminis]